MAGRIPARLTAAEGRRFGLSVGGAFLALAVVAWWRDHPTSSRILAALGGSLVVAGALLPTYLGPVERAWMRFAHLLSKVTTPVVMLIMYLLILTPIGVLRRMFGGNPMVHLPRGGSYWQARPPGHRAGRLTRQF